MTINTEEVKQNILSGGYEIVSQEEWEKIVGEVDDTQFSKISKLINEVLRISSKEQIKNTSVQIKSAVVKKINPDGTLDVSLVDSIDEDNVDTYWKNISNQTIYQNLKVGDAVKVMKETGKSNSCWVVGAFNSTNQYNVYNYSEERYEILKKYCNYLVDTIGLLADRVAKLESETYKADVDKAKNIQLSYLSQVEKLKNTLPKSDSQGNNISYS